MCAYAEDSMNAKSFAKGRSCIHSTCVASFEYRLALGSMLVLPYVGLTLMQMEGGTAGI